MANIKYSSLVMDVMIDNRFICHGRDVKNITFHSGNLPTYDIKIDIERTLRLKSIISNRF